MNNNSQAPGWPVTLVATAIISVLSTSSHASSADNSPMEIIEVTARGIEEPIKEVPFSIASFSAQELDSKQIFDSSDLFRYTGNFNYTDSGLPEANLINMRGIGSSSTFLSPSITYYIDGVPVPQRAFDISFLDVSRIEVLRGPQGTLFGQNAQAGALNITTKTPDENTRVTLSAEAGSQSLSKFSAGLSGKISDTLTASLQLRKLRHDGDIDNLIYNGPVDVQQTDKLRERDNTSAAAKLHYQLGDNTSITFNGRWHDDARNPTTGLLLDTDIPQNALAPAPVNDLDSRGYSVNIVHAFGDFEFAAISGIERYDLTMKADITDGFIASAGSPAPVFMFAPENALRHIAESEKQFTQEFRIRRQQENGNSWVAGLSYLDTDFSSATDITSPFLSNGRYGADISRKNTAAYAEMTYHTAPSTRLIAGLRVTNEKTDFAGLFNGREGGAPALPHYTESGDTDDTLVTGRVALSHDVSETTTGYLSVAKGAKAGGYPFYNQSAAFGIALSPFEKSSTMTYETGIKGVYPQAGIRFSSAMFFNDTKDEQLFIFNPLVGQFKVENADTESYGLESNLTLQLLQNLALSLDVAYLKAKAVEDNGASVRNGNNVPYAPELSGNLGLTYSDELNILSAQGELAVSIDYQHVGSRYIDPANSRDLTSYGLTNLYINYQMDSWSVYAYLKNAFDKSYVHSGFAAGMRPEGGRVFAGVPGQPRQAGVGISYRYRGL